MTPDVVHIRSANASRGGQAACVLSVCLLSSLAVVLMLQGMAGDSLAQETIIPLGSIKVSKDTGYKPQSKVWFHDGTWWAILPSTSVSPSGTWVWKLEANGQWTNALRVSSRTDSRADAKAIGDGSVVHILLHDSAPEVVSIEYVSGSYEPWTVRSTSTPISLPGSETATIDVDSSDRMWLSTESGSKVTVYYSDPPYFAFNGPIILANNINADDITVITALPDHTVGAFWSNQNTKRFGFRLHRDGDPPQEGFWLPDEVPAGQSANKISGGALADDHMNTAVASDATLYVSAKTSGSPEMVLLVRRPNGPTGPQWDNVYVVDTTGTRPQVLLNEDAGTIQFVYTAKTGGGNIVLKESALSPIVFGPRRTLITGKLNNATSTKANWTDAIVVVASGKAVLIARDAGVPTPTATASPTGAPAATSTATPSATPAATASAMSTAAAATSTQTPTPEPTAVSSLDLLPVADTYIERDTQATWDHGISDRLEVDLSPFDITYLKFDLSGVTAPVTQATLSFWCTNSTSDGGTIYPVADSSWIEGTRNGKDSGSAGGPGLKWIDVDTNGDGKIDALDTSPYVPAFASPTAPLGTVTSGKPVTVVVTNAFQAGPGLYSLAIKNDKTDGATYSSRNHPTVAQRPILHLELGPAP